MYRIDIKFYMSLEMVLASIIIKCSYSDHMVKMENDKNNECVENKPLIQVK